MWISSSTSSTVVIVNGNKSQKTPILTPIFSIWASQTIINGWPKSAVLKPSLWRAVSEMVIPQTQPSLAMLQEYASHPTIRWWYLCIMNKMQRGKWGYMSTATTTQPRTSSTIVPHPNVSSAPLAVCPALLAVVTCVILPIVILSRADHVLHPKMEEPAFQEGKLLASLLEQQLA